MALLLRLMDDSEPDVFSPFYDFGYGLTPAHVHRHHRPSSLRHLERQPSLESFLDCTLPTLQQLVRLAKEKERGGDLQASSLIGKDGFKVTMNVGEFKPEELKVKVVDKCIVVEGKHEEREDDHGYISRHFVRRYALPKDYDPDKVNSSLSSDGILTVSVPKPEAIEDKTKERVIQIQQTGPVKESPKQDAVKAKEEEKKK